MPTIPLLFHSSLSDLKSQLAILLPTENILNRTWEPANGGFMIHMDGYNIIFIEKSHSLTISYGSSKIRKRTGMSKEETKEYVIQLTKQWRDNCQGINDTKCSLKCKLLDFNYVKNDNREGVRKAIKLLKRTKPIGTPLTPFPKKFHKLLVHEIKDIEKKPMVELKLEHSQKWDIDGVAMLNDTQVTLLLYAEVFSQDPWLKGLVGILHSIDYVQGGNYRDTL